MTTARQIAWGVLAGFAVPTAATSVAILAGLYPIDPAFLDKYIRHWPLVATHGLAAVTAITAGTVQLYLGGPGPAPRRHKFVGRIYAVAVLIAALTALPMGLMAHGGPVAQVGMTINASLWLATLVGAIYAILRRDIPTHRRWMIRNLALTYSAVTLRVIVQVAVRLDLDYEAVYPLAAWANWLLPLAAVELWRVATARGAPWTAGARSRFDLRGGTSAEHAPLK